METNSLLVVLFHGVGGGNSLNVSPAAHREFLIFLKQNQNNMMIAPMIDVGGLYTFVTTPELRFQAKHIYFC